MPNTAVTSLANSRLDLIMSSRSSNHSSSRRDFLRTSLLATGSLALPSALAAAKPAGTAPVHGRVVSTWDFGVGANAAAWPVLARDGSALDAVEAGARWAEGDLCNSTVGHCGYPDRDGILTLDASIMRGDGGCGAVAGLEDIEHPVSVARAVMEKTPYVMIIGEGAQQFAVSQGFEKKPLLTDEARAAWHKWLATSGYQPPRRSAHNTMPGDSRNHDTLGIIALDGRGTLAGVCTTSGIAWKMHDRVADSAIIGAGLFVDNDVGAATASGVGEEMIRNSASFLVVELMRQGRTPTEACREAIKRVVHKRPAESKTVQVCFLAINRDGDVGAFALHPGFVYAVHDATPGPHDRLIKAGSIYTS
jgi:N4-(beta-N-acetylglucosaminyl)-L-asparaginase